jgi:DNA-binding transcriptional ArsR family regulator
VLADHHEHVRDDFALDVGPSTVSHHMKTLREAGLTRHRMEGTRCFVSLREEALLRFPGVVESVLRVAAAHAAEDRGTET